MSKEPLSRRGFLELAGAGGAALVLARLRLLRLQDEEVEPQSFFRTPVSWKEVAQYTVQTPRGPVQYSVEFFGAQGGPIRAKRWLGHEFISPPSNATLINLGTSCRGETDVDPEYCPVVASSDPDALAVIRSTDFLSVKTLNRKIMLEYQWLPMMEKNV